MFIEYIWSKTLVNSVRYYVLKSGYGNLCFCFSTRVMQQNKIIHCFNNQIGRCRYCVTVGIPERWYVYLCWLTDSGVNCETEAEIECVMIEGHGCRDTCYGSCIGSDIELKSKINTLLRSITCLEMNFNIWFYLLTILITCNYCMSWKQ